MRRLQGFTLIELLIVISIIGILATFTILSVVGARKRSYDMGAINCAKSLQTAQAIQQVDNKMYLAIGNGNSHLNSETDGVNIACKQDTLYIVDRSDPAKLVSDYVFDVWEARGSKVYTVTPMSLLPNQPNATAFSEVGAGGSNFP
ncbi:type II secretion system protein [Deinococcus sp. PESE-13]